MKAIRIEDRSQSVTGFGPPEPRRELVSSDDLIEARKRKLYPSNVTGYAPREPRGRNAVLVDDNGEHYEPMARRNPPPPVVDRFEGLTFGIVWWLFAGLCKRRAAGFLAKFRQIRSR